VTLSPEDAATSRAYDAACASLGVTPNTKAREGLLSASGVCDVSGACLGDDAACAVARAVARAPKVVHLSMRACDIGPDGFRRIFARANASSAEPPSLSSSASSALSSVDFSNNPRGLGSVGCRAFCRWLENAGAHVVRPAGLAVVELRGCDVRDADGAVLLAALAEAPALTKMNLAENALGAKSAVALAAFLETSPCLDVDVSANGFGSADAIAIAAAMRSRSNATSVERLNLARNGLEDAGCVAIAEALARNASVVSLDLSRTRFGSAAAKALAEAFAKNTHLVSVRLDGNDIGADGCASLLRALDASIARRKMNERSGGKGDDDKNEVADVASSLRAVSLVDARTEDAAAAARALSERRFLAEGGGKKAQEGQEGRQGEEGRREEGGQEGQGGRRRAGAPVGVGARHAGGAGNVPRVRDHQAGGEARLRPRRRRAEGHRGGSVFRGPRARRRDPADDKTSST
jgi:Ran GTPase-activating protein (RanGAP) involved in mRNA processing and transport